MSNTKLTERDRAKAIILEIIQQAGGRLQNKTHLYKAFYHAHIEFARKQRGYLSTWPIVRMPNGPGIDACDRLLGEMVADGLLEIEQVQSGAYQAFLFVAHPNPSRADDLPAGSVEAIRTALSKVNGKTTGQISEESHREAWELAENGEEMNIYLDLADPKPELQAQSDSVAAFLKEIWVK